MYLAIAAIGIRIVYKLKTFSITPTAVSWTIFTMLLATLQDTADGVIENFFNLCTMRIQIAAIADQMVGPIIPEYGLRTHLGY